VDRIGILGGTFNPPHIGHLVCAQEARAKLGLDRVLLMVAARPPHKAVPADPGPELRAALAEAAVAGDEGLEASRLELARAGPSYTVDTLAALHDATPEADLTFIAGADQAAGLPGWREPARVLALARLAVADRDGSGVDRERVRAAVAAAGGAPDRVEFFAMPRLDVSSTDLRARVAAGRPIRHLVPRAVEAAIAEQGLYRAAVAT
jgi:nicotinate-nucleotide adenylyltransferase